MIRLGTRGSALAMAQAGWVAERLGDAEIVVIETAGDRQRDRRFDQIGDGRGVFTREIERALIELRMDPEQITSRATITQLQQGTGVVKAART